jgi:hypothetical protein
MTKVRFRQADLRRALRAVKDAGAIVERIEIEPSTGKIVIIPAGAASAPDTELDTWLAKRHARATERR